MPDPVALQIIDALAVRLADVQTANSYNTDPTIHKGRRNFTWKDGDPARMSIWSPESMPPEDPRHAERVDVTQMVLIEGFAVADIDDPYDMGAKLVADIKKSVLGPEDKTLGHLVASMAWAGDSLAMPESGSKIVSVQVQISIRFPELDGDPYTVI